MEQKTTLIILFSSSVILYPLLRKDKYLFCKPKQMFLLGCIFIIVGIFFSIIFEGLNFTILNLTLKEVVFPGHTIALGYFAILISIYSWLEKIFKGRT